MKNLTIILPLLAVVSGCGLMMGSSVPAQAAEPLAICNPVTSAYCATITGNKLDVNATVNASIAGFTPSGNYSTLTATGSSARAAIPSGSPAVVVAYNTGTTAVSCILGNGSVTAVAGEDQIAPGGFFSYTVGANADLACIDQSGSASNVIVMSGGSGIATGSGGGGGSGGAITAASGSYSSGALSSGSIASGAVASGAVASGAYASGSIASGAIVDGADVTQGAKADSVCGTATGTCTEIALIKYLNSQVAAMPNTGGCGSIIPISQTTSTDLHTSSGKSYICSIVLVVPDAEVVSLIEGTGTVCATGTAAVIGATTAANGMSFAANGGFSAVSAAPMFNTQTTNDHFCLLQSGSGRIAGFISYNDH